MSTLLSGIREKRLCSRKGDEPWKCHHFPAECHALRGGHVALPAGCAGHRAAPPACPEGCGGGQAPFPCPALPWQGRLCGVEVMAQSQPEAAEFGPGYFPGYLGQAWPWACSPPRRGNVMLTATSRGGWCWLQVVTQQQVMDVVSMPSPQPSWLF